MKLGKKIMCGVLAVMMLFCLTACGSSAKDQTVVLTYEQDGVSMEYKMDAKGDVIQTITQTSTIDCSAYTEDDIALIEASIQEYAAIYEEYDGVDYSSETVDNAIIEIIKLDVSDSALVQSLADAQLLPIEGEGTTLSLEKTVENLTSQGWVQQSAE